MTTERAFPEWDSTPDPLDAPHFAENALVIKLGDPECIRAVVEAYRAEKQQVMGGLGAVLKRVDRPGLVGAKLTPIYPERALEVFRGNGPAGEAGWEVAVPDYGSPRRALSAYHYLHLGSTGQETLAEIARLEAALRSDPRIALVYHPAIPYAKDPPAGAVPGGMPFRAPGSTPFRALSGTPFQWGLKKCGFPDVWKDLDQGFDPGPIGVIDKGGDLGHPELAGRVQELPGPNPPSNEPHASAVMGVLAALRDSQGMDGCCSARIHLYNVATGTGLDPLAFRLALKAVACKGLRVVNVSLEMGIDPMIQDQVKECVDQGMIVVAAMGNDGTSVPVYPAAYPGVIAVGATNRVGKKLGASNTGTHIWLSAPGELIDTIIDKTSLGNDKHGTSYAAPMVSAAAWLALRVRPHYCGHHMKTLLAKSVHRVGQFDTQIGHGRLDMRRMLQELKC
jgi:hypothetical protein